MQLLTLAIARVGHDRGISFAGDFLSALLLKPTISVEAVSVNDYREKYHARKEKRHQY
jgi:hypothetical protein